MIAPRGKSWQVTVCRGGKRFRRSFRAREEAELWEAEATLQLVQGHNPIPKHRGDAPRTLKELQQLTFQVAWESTRGERTAWINSEDVVSTLGPATDIQSIDRSSVQRLIIELKKRGNSPATINRKLAALSKMMSVALDIGAVKDRLRVGRLKEAQHRTRFLTHDEERRLFAAIGNRDPEIRGLCIFLVETGLRVGEALGLAWPDVQGSLLLVRSSKNDKPRTVPLTEAAMEVLMRQAGQPAPWAHVNQSHLNSVWNAAKRDTGLDEPEIVPHILRHTCASRLIQNGVGLIVVQQWLGHRSMAMTMRYAHLSPAALDQARDVLDNLRRDES